MSKYQPLAAYLAGRSEPEVAMTFAEIEGVIGEPLPPAARKHRAWWANNESSSGITRWWKRAGFKSSEVDMSAQQLVFRRVAPAPGAIEPVVAEGAAAYAVRGRHPLWGALRGAITVARGTDLTAPADPDWGDASE
jgi:hypothetical protein